MLYKFKSKATGDLIMLQPNGRQILRIIGKDEGDSLVHGIVLPPDMPRAIAALEAAIAQDESDRAQRQAQARSADRNQPQEATVSLRQRALPFIDMLKRCHGADTEIVWGV